jgi:hypothetical protein
MKLLAVLTMCIFLMSCATAGTYRNTNYTHVHNKKTEIKAKPLKDKHEVLVTILLLPVYIALYTSALALQLSSGLVIN